MTACLVAAGVFLTLAYYTATREVKESLVETRDLCVKIAIIFAVLNLIGFCIYGF